MKKKIVALLLVALMVCTVLASCGSKKPSSNTTATTTDPNAGGEFAEIDAYVDSLAANSGTFGGAEFSIIGSPDQVMPEDEEITGNLENDALYQRMMELEDHFEIEMVYHESVGVDAGYTSTGAETADKVYTDVMSGLGSYDLIQGIIMTSGQVMLGNGVIRSVLDMDPLDFSRSWWLNDLEDQFGIGGELYFMTGKIVPTNYTDASCILFNKQVAEDYNLPDLYEIVSSDEWTFDKMVEVASVVDANSGTYRIRFGGTGGGLAYYFGGGFDVTQKDEDGNLSIPKSLSQSQVDYIDKLKSVFSDTAAVCSGDLYYALNKDTGLGEDWEGFVNGMILFETNAMGTPAHLRQKDVEFGILPIPKASVDQEEYISYSSAWTCGGVYFSNILKDEVMTATVTEAMAALSEKYMEPAYYEKSLQGRGTYDTESRDMLDIIYKTKKYDLADTYQWGKVVHVINDAVSGTNPSYVSSYSSSAGLANIELKKIENMVKSSK